MQLTREQFDQIEAMGGPQEAGAVLLLIDSAYEGRPRTNLPSSSASCGGAAQSAAQAAVGAGQAAVSAS
ncbi:hypothetical protein VITFI_CDS3202 [Vitreoscilla filiformis]|jgi:hypothetical protein|uniref:Uncharacterized protein n=1 Tax=Vitreoscilla filiformis TaxID=63 RepID=A0A221KJ93_VITFI|nr:hypothetical protein VITFI_CDS3202 [Vitreoscilla filiformis]